MKQRQSNIELLRCLLMLMIVIIHFLGHNILSATNPIDINNPHFYTANLLLAFCECAVDCFVLISGWFLINFSIRKIIMFLLPIAFYQFVISCIYYPYGGSISISPFHYWFVPPFVALMILSPVINKALKSISKKKLQVILLCLTLIFILPIQSLSGMYGKNAFIFIYIYCLGFYLKNHFDNKYSKITYLSLFLISVLLIFAETIVLGKTNHYEGTRTLSYSYDNILIIFAAVFLLLFFSKLELQSNVINKISLSAFFVYIITENENVYSNPDYSIYKILDVQSWEANNLFIIKIIGASILLFSIAILVDITRRLIFQKPEKLLSEKINVLEQKISDIENVPINKPE